MEEERKKELLQLICTAMKECRGLGHDDLVEHNILSSEICEICEIAGIILAKSEILRSRESSENLVVDYVVIDDYLRRAISFLRDVTEILKPYEEGLSVPTISFPFLKSICDKIDDVDFYIGGIKSYVRLGVMHRVVDRPHTDR